ncbi:hypothetical protein [Sandarakinorhabdus oryzae]|uniref:hypothetical protein n=1 Tax=Sandarakinorhabdus oryzae TaxID=2675220 RepID=UPI0012E31C13|nr:hypothetical protein [Sandarakinorhabdus oryzae]
MTLALHALDKAAISALMRSQMELTTAGLKLHLKRSAWIGKSNHYRQDVVAKLKVASPATVQHQRNLAQYIAASAALHSNDGWSYLGRSVACLLAGDTHRALHLAYYAELRAAMSLLASAGIGIFSNRHYVVSAANQTSKLRIEIGTHVAAWLALEEWSQLPASGALFGRLIRPEGRTLDEWFHAQGGAVTLAPQAKAWFMQWGMDLALATKDRDARNDSSYRPDGIPQTGKMNPKVGFQFVRDMWSTLEPSATSSFENIDRHILRIAMERYYQGLTGKPASAADPAFVALVDAAVSAQSLATSTEDRLKRFLLRRIAADDPLIFRYSGTRPGAPETDAFAVMARAVLLLRVATGSAHDLLHQAGFNAAALSFWWQKLGEARGLWKPGAPPVALADLWADIEDGLREVEEIEVDDPASFETMSGVAYGAFGRLHVLASHERVGLWGLCPT